MNSCSSNWHSFLLLHFKKNAHFMYMTFYLFVGLVDGDGADID